MYREISFVFLLLFLFFSEILLPNTLIAKTTNTYTIAILDLEANGVSNIEAKGLSEKIRTRISWLINTELYSNSAGTIEYVVVERSQMDKILEQFEIQSAVCTDVSCAIEFGKMFHADRIIIGSVNVIGKTFNVTARLIDVETAKTLTVSEVDHKGSIDGLLGSTIQDVADELILGTPFRDWENSEFIIISGNPDDASVTLNRKNIGSAPLQNKMAPLGNNSIRIRKSGYEDFREKVRIRKGSPYQLNYTLSPKTRKRTFLKSLILPGSGQCYAEYKAKGYLITLLQAAAIAGVVETTMTSVDAQNEYNDAKDAYINSSSQNDFDKNYIVLEDKHDERKSAHTLQLITGGVALAVYLYNLIDAALTEPKVEDRFTEKSFLITPSISMNHTSISLSVRF